MIHYADVLFFYGHNHLLHNLVNSYAVSLKWMIFRILNQLREICDELVYIDGAKKRLCFCIVGYFWQCIFLWLISKTMMFVHQFNITCFCLCYVGL